MNKKELDMGLLKEVLLNDYKNKQPHPFIQFDVFSDPRCFDDEVSPDEDGYCTFAGHTHELMSGAYGVRILIDPETPKNKVIGSLRKVVEWIKKSKILEELIDKLQTGGTYHALIEGYQREQKYIEIGNHLKKVGYSEAEISDFCRLHQSGHGDALGPF
jgi:hypothetical protein